MFAHLRRRPIADRDLFFVRARALDPPDIRRS
jgi:hypothetical protein